MHELERERERERQRWRGREGHSHRKRHDVLSILKRLKQKSQISRQKIKSMEPLKMIQMNE